MRPFTHPDNTLPNGKRKYSENDWANLEAQREKNDDTGMVASIALEDVYRLTEQASETRVLFAVTQQQINILNDRIAGLETLKSAVNALLEQNARIESMLTNLANTTGILSVNGSDLAQEFNTHKTMVNNAISALSESINVVDARVTGYHP